MLVNNPIENVSRRPAIRRVVTLLVPSRTPSDKLRPALAIASAESSTKNPSAARSIRSIDGVECPPQVRFEDVQAGNFKVTVTYCYAPATDPGYAAHAERVNLRIVEELQKAGVELQCDIPAIG